LPAFDLESAADRPVDNLTHLIIDTVRCRLACAKPILGTSALERKPAGRRLALRYASPQWADQSMSNQLSPGRCGEADDDADAVAAGIQFRGDDPG